MPIARPFFNDAHAFTAKVTPPGTRDFVELIVTDNAGTLSGVLRLHGLVYTSPGGGFRLVRAVKLFTESGRATEGFTTIASGGSPPSYSYDPALTNTTCNGAFAIDTPLGVTDFTFLLGNPTPAAGLADIVRARVVRSGKFDGEHWDTLTACTTIGSTIYFNQARKVVEGHTRIQTISTTGVGEFLLCGGGSFWAGGGPNGGHVDDSNVSWLTQAAAAVTDSRYAGPMYQWAIPSNTTDFTSTPIPANAFCYQPTPVRGTRLQTNSIVWIAPGPNPPSWPNPSAEWICHNPNLPPGWPNME